jgi:hypothetical protein
MGVALASFRAALQARREESAYTVLDLLTGRCACGFPVLWCTAQFVDSNVPATHF